jgi:DNA ligase-1
VTGNPLAPDAYRRTSSAVMSYDNNDALNSKFYVFDMWDSAEQYVTRYNDLLSLDLPTFCEVLETETIYNEEQLLEYEAGLLALGHEGVILRDLEGYYKFGRSTPKEGKLIKMKQFVDAEAKIIALHELRHNANEQTTNELGYSHRSGHQDNLIGMDTLGAIECVGLWPDGSMYSVRIGTGFDEETRLRLWRERDKLIGKLVKFKYFPAGVKEAPRFPVFLGFRDPDDMSPVESKQLSLFD